ALSLKLEDPNRVAGFLRVGSKVVVFYTSAGKTRTLLTDIQVLATSLSGAPVTVSPLVTLAVTQQEAQKLVFAAQGDNTIYLALEGDDGTAGLDPKMPGVT